LEGESPSIKTSGNCLLGISYFSLFCLLAPLDSAWDSLGLCLTKTVVRCDLFLSTFQSVSKVKHGIVTENVHAAACYCFIRVTSFHETLHLAPFCTNPSDTPSLSLTVVAGLRVRYSRHRSSAETFFLRKIFSLNDLFVMRGIRDEKRSWNEVLLYDCISVHKPFDTKQEDTILNFCQTISKFKI
jgi:hypothetical protein